MKRSIIIVCAFTFITCNKENPASSVPFQEGAYNGTYKLVNKDGTVDEGAVFFNFSPMGEYFCYGEKRLSPPSGGGKYTVSGNKIVLTDLHAHTADFDWSLILNGEFISSYDGAILMLIQLDIQQGRTRTIVLNRDYGVIID